MPPLRLVHRALWPRPATQRAPQRRLESTYQPPSPNPKSGSDRHRDFYRTFGRPLAKNFLIAVAAYQVLYFSWLKLESYEVKKQGEGEVKKVEGELRGLVGGGGGVKE